MSRWLLTPPLAGHIAIATAVTALGLGTIVRAAINDYVSGCEFTAYLPFVLISAILLPWWQAGLVALASALILGTLFIGAPGHLPISSPCFLSGAGIFLAASAAIIGFVFLVRHILTSIQRSGADESEGGVLFSLSEGQVWASWYGQRSRVLLGSQEKVSGMMEDFLAQVEVGKRLNRDD